MWGYSQNPKFTKLRKSSNAVPAQAVYYCHVLCMKHPEIDGKFAPFLNDALKSDSEVNPTGEAGVQDSSNKRKSFDALVQTISTATTDMSKAIQAKTQQKDEARNERAQWDEYFSLSERFLAMAQDVDDNRLPLLSVMAIRLRMLDKSVGIATEQSVTNGVHGIPPVAEVVTVSATSNRDNDASDITSAKESTH
jgi:hypothetical protein